MEQVSDNLSERKDFGVYFLANNREIHWAYAFLVSFRKTNPTLPLTLIPYNDQFDQIEALADRFNFNMLASDSYAELDELNKQTGGSGYNHTFRKFAAFWGIYDRFFYLDTDIIVTSDLRPLDAAAVDSRVDFAFIETFETHIDHVYKPGALRDRMVTQYRTKAFNTGAWWSCRGLFSREEIAARMQETAGVRGDFAPSGEQPYINYCCDVRGLRTEQFSDLVPNLMPTSMASAVNGKWNGGRFLQTNGEWAGREISMIHFASFGIPQAAMPNYLFYLSNRAEAQGFVKTQLWNLRWQGQRIKFQILGLLKPKR